MAGADLLSGQEQRPSLLPFDPKDLVAMRVRPADFARMCSVSKQTVSVWIKKGTVTLGPDGLLDPSKAARDVLQRTDPARIRARVFKLASATYEELRERIKALEAELSELKGAGQVERDKMLTRAFLDQQAKCIFDFSAALVEQFGDLAEVHHRGGADELEEAIDSIIEAAFYDDNDEQPEALTASPGDFLLEHQRAAMAVAADNGDLHEHEEA